MSYLFSRCLFFLIKASKKDNYQLGNKEFTTKFDLNRL
ncbi:hypothetical protein M132_0669 [Bacteroides fragilis str. S24L15]|nr:hypothetical protein M132_1246 [Bacteroides fragilis str. S24L15]EYA72623.1 hypothetical protein M132_0669 [Bacteroides fragilis str. S24L15]OCR37572.1 hypothetical protein AC239_41380 [Bacteroides fragilis]